MKPLFKLFTELLLLLIATPIFWLVAVMGVVYTFFKHAFKLDYSLMKQMAPLVRSVNLINDCLANAAGGEMLNDALKVRGQIKYGKWYQTISAVSGLLYLYGQDTWLRRFLDKIIGRRHCEDAINPEDKLYWENILK